MKTKLLIFALLIFRISSNASTQISQDSLATFIRAEVRGDKVIIKNVYSNKDYYEQKIFDLKEYPVDKNEFQNALVSGSAVGNNINYWRLIFPFMDANVLLYKIKCDYSSEENKFSWELNSGTLNYATKTCLWCLLLILIILSFIGKISDLVKKYFPWFFAAFSIFLTPFMFIFNKADPNIEWLGAMLLLLIGVMGFIILIVIRKIQEQIQNYIDNVMGFVGFVLGGIGISNTTRYTPPD